MNTLDSRVQFLYDDLITLGVGHFLVSKSFMKMLTKMDYEAIWHSVIQNVEEKNIASGIKENEVNTAEKALFTMLIHFQEPKVKSISFNLINDFIDSINLKTNFKELLDSIALLRFDELHKSQLQNQVTLHNSKFNATSSTKEAKEKTALLLQKKRIFLVHGHDEGKLQAVARLIEKQGLMSIILKEQPNAGMTLIEKFEANAKTDFAIILFTGDDKGKSKHDKHLNSRARQNVVLETGYFFALLGRENVVCLREKDIEIPSDLKGELFINLDESGSWKYKLIKELRNAGFKATADIL